MIVRFWLRKKRNLIYVLLSAVVVILILYVKANSKGISIERKSSKQVVPREGHTEIYRSTKLGNSTNFHILYNSAPEQDRRNNYYQPREFKINEHGFEYIIHETNICAEEDPPFLLVLIPSIHGHVLIRKTIRQTWGQVTKRIWLDDKNFNLNVKVMFLFGKSIHEEDQEIIERESVEFHDVIQENYLESYFNLTHKILGGLKWASQFCADASYILKIDEDTMPHIPNIINILKTDASQDQISGHIVPAGSTVRRSGRWSVSRRAFPFDSYPRYLFGNSYVIPTDLLPKILRVSEYMPYVPMEDVFITGIVAKVLEITHRHINGMTFWLEKPPSACEFMKKLRLTGTKVTPSLMTSIWNEMKMNSFTQACD